MTFAALLLIATTTYQSVLGFDPPVFQSGAAKYEFYAQGDLEDGRRVVVFGFTPARRGNEADVEHEMYVALLTRRGRKYELVSARRFMTDAVFNTGARGHFKDFRAVVNAFKIGRRQYVDVSFWSSISSGDSAANDVIFRLASDSTLVIATRIDETQSFSRSSREIRETTSELGVGGGVLVVTKRERVASRDNTNKPFRVNCRTSRIGYRPFGRRMEQTRELPKAKFTPLPRAAKPPVVPCCNGCELASPAR